jgi:hypothetical protein
MNQDEYIKERLDGQIKWYDKKSSENQNWYKGLQILLVLSGITIPFLSGFVTTESITLKIIVGALGLIIVAISAVNGIFKFQENWITFRTTCESLKHEKYLFLAKAEPYDIDDPYHFLAKRVEALISKENTKWANYIRKTENKTDNT